MGRVICPRRIARVATRVVQRESHPVYRRVASISSIGRVVRVTSWHETVVLLFATLPLPIRGRRVIYLALGRVVAVVQVQVPTVPHVFGCVSSLVGWSGQIHVNVQVVPYVPTFRNRRHNVLLPQYACNDPAGVDGWL